MNLKTGNALIICLLLFATTSTYGQAGSLDNTFGIGGIVTTAIGNGYVYGSATAIQTDGKILVAGSFSYNNMRFEFALIRYNTDGSIDSSLGTNGIDTTAIDSFNDVAAAVAIEPNGKIVVAGSSNDSLNNKFALVRYNQNGSLDTTFGVKGKVTTSFDNTYDDGNSMAIQPDGKIVVAGSASYKDSTTEFAVARYDSTGAPDATFGDNGEVVTSIYGYDDEGYSVALQNDGKIVVAGIALDSINYEFAVVRYDLTGTIDSSFGNYGKVTTDILGYGDFAYSVALQSNGQIVAAGRSFNYITNAFMFAAVRYNADGTLDNTFGWEGKDTTSIGGYDDEGYSVAIQPADQKIVVAGYAEISAFDEFALIDEFALVRYNTDGSLDTVATGGMGSGKVTTAIDSVSSGAAVLIQPADGKIVVAGYSVPSSGRYYNVAVVRYLPSLTLGIVDLAKENNSVFIYPNPIHDEGILEYTLANDEVLSITLYDITGKLMQTIVTSENISEGTHRQPLDLQVLPSGVYMLAITNSSMQCLSVKIIKQ